MVETVGALIIASAGAGEIGGIAGLGTLAGTTIGGVSLATVVGGAAVLGVSIGLNYALSNTSIPKPEDGSQALKQAVPPRIKAYGLNRLAGYYMLFEAAAAPPATSYDVLAFHSGRISSIDAFYFSDDVVTTNADISHGNSAFVQATYTDGRYGSGNIVLETRIGIPGEIALTSFTTDSSINGLWTTAHVGHGIAHIGLKCGGIAKPEDFSRTYPKGRPELSVLATCSPCWDPRSPSQSRLDVETWLPSFNPVIQLIDYLTNSDSGMGLDLDIILPPERLAEWMIEADVCDQLVATADGPMEVRYASSGWFRYDNKPEDVIGGITSTCDGWLAESGDGTLSLTVGLFREPTIAPLTEKHIVGFALNYGQADEQMVNELDITFTDPNQKYVSVQADSWRDEESISLTGIVRTQALDLKWVQSNSQARRLAGRAMQRLNPLMTGSFTTTLYGLSYLGKRWIPLKYPFVSGLQDCVVEIQNSDVDLMRGRITWDFIRVAPDKIEAYQPDTDEGAAPVIPPPAAHLISLDFSEAINSQYLALLEDI